MTFSIFWCIMPATNAEANNPAHKPNAMAVMTTNDLNLLRHMFLHEIFTIMTAWLL
jgi:hypothetical protein